MNRILALLGGIILMAAGVFLVIVVYWEEFYRLIFGIIPPFLFFLGLIAFIAGVSSLKDASRLKKLEKETEE